MHFQDGIYNTVAEYCKLQYTLPYYNPIEFDVIRTMNHEGDSPAVPIPMSRIVAPSVCFSNTCLYHTSVILTIIVL